MKLNLQTKSTVNMNAHKQLRCIHVTLLKWFNVLFYSAHLGTHFDWGDEELEKNWKREPMNIQQRIADKCRNLNKKKNKQ